MDHRAVVVLVEDDPSLRGALTFAFEADGLDVRAYADGHDLLAADDLPMADCLVIDFKLPRLDGLALLAMLRQRALDAPAILVTSNPDRRCRRAALAAGVEIVEKPLMDGELRRRIGLAIERFRGSKA